MGGNASGISQALKSLGFESDVLATEQNYLDFPVDFAVFRPEDGRFLRELKRLKALSYTLRYDAVFFNSGRSLYSPLNVQVYDPDGVFRKSLRRLHATYHSCMQLIELAILKVRGVPILVQYQGDDARQGDYCLREFEVSIAHYAPTGYYTRWSDRMKRRQIRRMNKWADWLFALNPDLLKVLPSGAAFLPYAHCDPLGVQVVPFDMSPQPLIVGHAPTNREAKGTHLVIDAVTLLQERGLSIRLLLIEGMSHEQALRAYSEVDILVDQLFAGWYGGVAVEVMAMGKPVAAYIRDSDLDQIPTEMKQQLPIVRVTKDNLVDVLAELASRERVDLAELGKASRQYVERWHSPTVIARSVADRLALDPLGGCSSTD